MRDWVLLFTRAYRILLAFYPSKFRAEFGEEMQDVFAAMLTEDPFRGTQQPWQLFWREICDWPGSVLQEHMRERRWTMPSNGFVEEKPITRSELLAAMVIFVLPLISIIATENRNLPEWMDYFLVILFFGVVLFALGLTIVKGLPRWSPPYLGFVLLLAAISLRYDRLWSWIYPFFTRSFGPMSHWSIPLRIFYSGIFAFIILFSILLGAVILVNLLGLLPFTRDLWQRIRADWTQLSFMVYGALVFGILLVFDEYHYESIWKMIAWIFLALGAWFYLQAKGNRQRIRALIGGATGAMWTVALAKWVLIPLQMWPTGYPVSPSEATRWVEVGAAIINWAVVLILLIAPALLKMLPSNTGWNDSKAITPA